MRGLVLVAVLVVTLPAAVAVSPTDDDCGSGGDAGDVAPLAVTIALPAACSGALTPPGDFIDDYDFHADAGDVVDFTIRSERFVELNLYTPAGLQYESLFPSTQPWPVVFNETGQWMAEIISDPFSPRATYTFSAVADSNEHAVRLDPLSEWSLTTIHWTEGANLRIFGRGVPAADPTMPAETMFIEQWDGTIEGRQAHVDDWVGLGQYGTGSQVIAGGVSGDLPVHPALPNPPDSGFLALSGWAQFGEAFPFRSSGTIRIVQMVTDLRADARLDVFSEGDVSIHREAGHGYVAWGDADNGGVQVPGVSLVGPGDLVLNVGPGFSGIVDVGGAPTGWIESPDGIIHPLIGCNLLGPAYGSCAPYAMLIGEAGTWHVHIDAQTGLVFPQALHVVGASGGDGWTPAFHG